MLATLGWLIAMVAFVGAFTCIARAFYYVMRWRVDPDTRGDSQRKLMIGMAAFICFFLLAAVGAILLQISGAYGSA